MPTLIKVTADYLQPDGSHGEGFIAFQPAQTMVDETDDIIIPACPTRRHVQGGTLAIDLYANDDPTTDPHTYYVVTERLTDGEINIYYTSSSPTRRLAARSTSASCREASSPSRQSSRRLTP